MSVSSVQVCPVDSSDSVSCHAVHDSTYCYVCVGVYRELGKGIASYADLSANWDISIAYRQVRLIELRFRDQDGQIMVGK